jgi:hypothetical protein
MKAVLLLGLLLAGNAFSQSLKDCTTEVLKCELYEELITGERVKLAEAVEHFSGYNWDEPSIPPYECSLELSIEGKDGLIFVVSMGDSDYVASVYNLKRPYLGTVVGSDASFPVVKGKTFYFRNMNQNLQCKLY